MKKTIPFVLALLVAGAAIAAPLTSLDSIHVKAGKAGMRSDKIEFRSSGGTGIHTVKSTDSSNTARVLTLPDATDTLVGKATTDTLTNKTLTGPTLTSPAISGTVTGGASYTAPTLTSPTVSGTVAGGASYTAPTLTSPTISGTVAGAPTASGIWTFSAIPVVPAASFARTALVEEALVVDAIPLATVKELTGLQLGATASAGKFGLSQSGSFASPTGNKLVAEDCNNTTKTDYCTAYSKVPLSFVAGQSMNVQVTVAMTGAGAAVAAPNSTIDVKVYRIAGDGSVSTDLCTTAAQALAASATVRTFACDTTSVVPGDVLVIWVEMVGIEGAAASAIGEIDKLAVAYDTQG